MPDVSTATSVRTPLTTAYTEATCFLQVQEKCAFPLFPKLLKTSMMYPKGRLHSESGQNRTVLKLCNSVLGDTSFTRASSLLDLSG